MVPILLALGGVVVFVVVTLGRVALMRRAPTKRRPRNGIESRPPSPMRPMPLGQWVLEAMAYPYFPYPLLEASRHREEVVQEPEDLDVILIATEGDVVVLDCLSYAGPSSGAPAAPLGAPVTLQGQPRTASRANGSMVERCLGVSTPLHASVVEGHPPVIRLKGEGIDIVLELVRA